MFKLPSLTELFFGKGVDPATYAPSYLSGKGKRARSKGQFVGDDKSTPNVNEAWEGGKAPTKKVDISKSITKEKPIKEVTKAAPKNAKSETKPRGTRKDYALDKKLKEVKSKPATRNYRAGKI
mgnify:CR=1 FL=1